jgi:hypothetical protein
MRVRRQAHAGGLERRVGQRGAAASRHPSINSRALARSTRPVHRQRYPSAATPAARKHGKVPAPMPPPEETGACRKHALQCPQNHRHEPFGREVIKVSASARNAMNPSEGVATPGIQKPNRLSMEQPEQTLCCFAATPQSDRLGSRLKTDSVFSLERLGKRVRLDVQHLEDQARQGSRPEWKPKSERDISKTTALAQTWSMQSLFTAKLGLSMDTRSALPRSRVRNECDLR